MVDFDTVALGCLQDRKYKGISVKGISVEVLSEEESREIPGETLSRKSLPG